MKTLLFDLDGTLTDPKEGITKSIQYALEKLGRPTPCSKDLEWCIGPPLKGSFEKLLLGQAPGTVDEALRLYRVRYQERGMYENTPYPGVAEMLSKLSSFKFRLFVATSKPTIFADQILNYFKLKPYFSRVYGSELNGNRSDKGELIKHILLTEDLQPSDAVMIGDREHDIRGARKNGVSSVGVSYGYGSAEELKDAGYPSSSSDELRSHPHFKLSSSGSS